MLFRGKSQISKFILGKLSQTSVCLKDDRQAFIVFMEAILSINTDLVVAPDDKFWSFKLVRRNA